MELVKLFSTPNARYAFDAPTSKLLQIEEETYQFLKNGGESVFDEGVTEEFKKLVNMGYFSGKSPVKMFVHPYRRVLSSVLNRGLSQMTLQLTQECNFRCSYCVYSENANKKQRSHSKRNMTWDVAKTAVDFLWEHSVDSENVNIGFYGGEPLLQRGLVEKVIEYSKEKFAGKVITFGMTCNGSLLSEMNVELLEENDVHLLVSLDGPKTIHDKNRVFVNGSGTYDVVMQRLSEIKEKHPDYWSKIHFSMVLDPQNDFDEINEICKNDMIKAENIMASMLDLDYDDIRPEVSEEYYWKEEYQRFLAFIAQWGQIPKKEVSPLVERGLERLIYEKVNFDMASPLRPIDMPSGPCVPGKQRMLVDVDGNIFPCERVSENSEIMRIGDIINGFDMEKVDDLLQVGSLTEDACNNCWSFRFCSQCAKKADVDGSELVASARLKYCKENQIAAFEKVKSFILMQEIPEYYREQLRKREEV